VISNSEARTRHNAGGPASVAADRHTTSMLLFRSGDHGIKAVPLGLVARLEQIAHSRIETASGAPVTQYRGCLMRLLPMSGHLDATRTEHAVLVFSDQNSQGEQRMGLIVDEIVDVVEERLNIELAHAKEGTLGTAIIAGRATDVIDTSYWLTKAEPNWFDSHSTTLREHSAAHVLVVEDSHFFRQMIVPVLQAAGYAVTAAPDAARALAMREAGRQFDAIISDIDMPDMDGLAFAREIRAGGAWADLPVIALSALVREADVEAGRSAGFTDYVSKSAKTALLTSLRECLAISPGSEEVARLVA
jgi:two-component system chemotaxis sensor kinase CheA